MKNLVLVLLTGVMMKTNILAAERSDEDTQFLITLAENAIAWDKNGTVERHEGFIKLNPDLIINVSQIEQIKKLRKGVSIIMASGRTYNLNVKSGSGATDEDVFSVLFAVVGQRERVVLKIPDEIKGMLFETVKNDNMKKNSIEKIFAHHHYFRSMLWDSFCLNFVVSEVIESSKSGIIPRGALDTER